MRLVLSIPLILASCGEDRPSEIPAPPPSLTPPCALPQSLPERALSQSEVELLWGRDRSSLRSCASRHDGLADYILDF